jgi:hypothetical protein
MGVGWAVSACRCRGNRVCRRRGSQRLLRGDRAVYTAITTRFCTHTRTRIGVIASGDKPSPSPHPTHPHPHAPSHSHPCTCEVNIHPYLRLRFSWMATAYAARRPAIALADGAMGGAVLEPSLFCAWGGWGVVRDTSRRQRSHRASAAASPTTQTAPPRLQDRKGFKKKANQHNNM